jgi:hypothetical protein
MLRKILVVLALLILTFIGAGFYFIHRIDSQAERKSREDQQKLEPRVITGGGRFEKTKFYAGENLGEITQILVGWPADREGADLTIVGNEGAHFLDAGGTQKKQIHFSEFVACTIEVARVDPSGDYGFLTRDESWAVDATFFDKQGQKRWSYPGGFLKGIDDSVAGDVTGHGKLEVVIGFNGNGGLVLVDGGGKKIWQKAEGNVWHVETIDTKGDGRKEILHSNARGQLLVRSASGEIVAHYLPDHYVCDFSLTRWGSEPQASHILIPSKESGEGCCKPVILVLDAEGHTVAHFDAPLSDLMHDTRGTPVRYARGAEYYAVLQNHLERSVLFLFDNNGQIAYQEVIGDSCLGIAALPGKVGDRLLIGCSGRVWEYSPAIESIKAQPGKQSERHLSSADSR